MLLIIKGLNRREMSGYQRAGVSIADSCLANGLPGDPSCLNFKGGPHSVLWTIADGGGTSSAEFSMY